MMLNALRASTMLLVLVGTARAGEVLIPPAAPQQRSQTTLQEPYSETLYAETTTPEMSDTLADAALELLTVLSAIL